MLLLLKRNSALTRSDKTCIRQANYSNSNRKIRFTHPLRDKTQEDENPEEKPVPIPKPGQVPEQEGHAEHLESEVTSEGQNLSLTMGYACYKHSMLI